MRIYQYVMIAKMVLADKPTNKESESIFFINIRGADLKNQRHF